MVFVSFYCLAACFLVGMDSVHWDEKDHFNIADIYLSLDVISYTPLPQHLKGIVVDARTTC